MKLILHKETLKTLISGLDQVRGGMMNYAGTDGTGPSGCADTSCNTRGGSCNTGGTDCTLALGNSCNGTCK